MVEEAHNNLEKDHSNSSGKLASSLHLDEPTQNGNVVRVDVLMNQYGRYVNKGVKGTVSGKSTAGYSFKTPLPSTAMVKSSAEGIGRAKKSTSVSDVKKYSTHGGHEKKLANLSNITKAFGAGVNIKRYGIKPTGFLDKAVATTVASVRDRLGAALKIDVINSINKPGA